MTSVKVLKEYSIDDSIVVDLSTIHN